MQISPNPGQAAPTCLSAEELAAVMYSMILDAHPDAMDQDLSKAVKRVSNELIIFFNELLIRPIGAGVYSVIEIKTKERKFMTYAMIEEILISKL